MLVCKDSKCSFYKKIIIKAEFKTVIMSFMNFVLLVFYFNFFK